MTIYEYVKLNNEEKERLLREEALLFDYYHDGTLSIFVYHLINFFVEVTISDGKVISNLPYISGYKVEKKQLHMIEKRSMLQPVSETNLFF